MLAEESCLEAGDLFLARMYDVCCAAMLGLANSWHHSYCAEDAHAAADIHGHPGHCWKLLDRYCSKLRPFVPFGLHIQMICPLLATSTDACSKPERAWNLWSCPLKWPVAGSRFSRGMCLGSRFKAGSTMEICVSNRIITHLVPRYLCGPYCWIA